MNGTSCSLHSLTQTPLLPISPTAAETMRYLQGVYYFAALPIGILLNVMGVVLIAKFKKLHTTSFYLILQVIVVDALVGIFLFPVASANIIADGWVFGDVMCQLQAVFLFFLRYSRNLLMLVLAIDRLCSIFFPFWYARHQVHLVVPMSLLAWLLSFVVALIPVYGILGCYEFQRHTWICALGNGCAHRMACSRYRTGFVSVANISIFISLIMYLILYCKARHLKKKTNLVPSPQNTSCSIEERSSSDSSGSNSSGSGDSGNNNIVKVASEIVRKRFERRATITYILLFLALFGVSFPAFLFFVVGSSVLSELGIWPPPEGYTITSIITRSLFSLLVIIDPITLMRNADVREAIGQSMKKLKQLMWKDH